MNEREAFEKWCAIDDTNTDKDGNGEYISHLTHSAWLGWQSALAYARTTGDASIRKDEASAQDGVACTSPTTAQSDEEAKADEHTAHEIAAVICACYMTDGFCTSRNKPDCKCNALGKEAARAIRFREKFTRPEIAVCRHKDAQHQQKVRELVEKYRITGNYTMVNVLEKHFGE